MFIMLFCYSFDKETILLIVKWWLRKKRSNRINMILYFICHVFRGEVVTYFVIIASVRIMSVDIETGNLRIQEINCYTQEHSLTHSHSNSFFHSLFHLLIHSLTHPFTHSLFILSLSYSPSLCHTHTPRTCSYNYCY